MKHSTSCADGAQVSEEPTFIDVQNPWLEQNLRLADQFSQLDGFWSACDDMAETVRADYKAAGKKGEVSHKLVLRVLKWIHASWAVEAGREIDAEGGLDLLAFWKNPSRLNAQGGWHGNRKDLIAQGRLKCSERQLTRLLKVLDTVGLISRWTRGIEDPSNPNSFVGTYIVIFPNFEALMDLHERTRLQGRRGYHATEREYEDPHHVDRVAEEACYVHYDVSPDDPAQGLSEEQIIAFSEANSQTDKIGRGNSTLTEDDAEAGLPEARIETREASQRCSSLSEKGATSLGTSAEPGILISEEIPGRVADTPDDRYIDPGIQKRDASFERQALRSASKDPVHYHPGEATGGLFSDRVLDPDPGSRFVDSQKFWQNALQPLQSRSGVLRITKNQARLMRIFFEQMRALGIRAVLVRDREIAMLLLHRIKRGEINEMSIMRVVRYLEQLKTEGGQAGRRAVFAKTLRRLLRSWDLLMREATVAIDEDQLAVVHDWLLGGHFQTQLTSRLVQGRHVLQAQWRRLTRYLAGYLSRRVDLTEAADLETRRNLNYFMQTYGDATMWNRWTRSGATHDLRLALGRSPQALTRFWMWFLDPMLRRQWSDSIAQRERLVFANSQNSIGMMRNDIQALAAAVVIYMPDQFELLMSCKFVHENANGQPAPGKFELLKELNGTRMIHAVARLKGVTPKQVMHERARIRHDREKLRIQTRRYCEYAGIKLEHLKVFRAVRIEDDFMESDCRLMTEQEYNRSWNDCDLSAAFILEVSK